jgi:hypothetical protein
MCCDSIICSDKWSPANTIENIINDIKKFRKYKKMIIIKILVDSIINKYLISDINLFGYLH